MAKNSIPVALIDAETYINGSNNLAGMSEIELPKIEYDTVTTEQMGMTAELDVPLHGHFKKLEAKLKLDMIDETIVDLNNGEAILIECKGAAQKMNKQTHGADIYGIDATFKGLIKNIEGPKMKPSGKLETSIDLSVTYYKLTVGEKTLVEIDVLNNINSIHGLKNDIVRRFLGLA
ncbi:MAG TPA: phage major tail tube protein [Fusobacterium sp.]|uniref:phage major tail tube protein n=1 Tax=Fusobacterium sp. TaxID=68766 RepID=UPI002F42CBC6